MIEYILCAGLSFLIGLSVGRHVGRADSRDALIRYVMTVNTMHNIVRQVHEKHGLVEEVDAALREHGIEVRKFKTGD